jgi:hypothetical protein
MAGLKDKNRIFSLFEKITPPWRNIQIGVPESLRVSKIWG